ncbi:MAG: FAD-dependent oxidoreductase [Myxococcales bacterium]|nr:FAD-dependent oxidoreductase [Myxococcales bacterium]
MTSRRDFLAYLLGGSFAAACDRRGSALGAGGLHIPGEIIDTGAARGHQFVRDYRALGTAPLAPATWEQVDVAIIGGGPSGLSAAWELGRQGKRCVVLELMPEVGGTARAGLGAVTAFPWGAHYIVAPDAENSDLTSLLDEMGAIDEIADDGTPVVHEHLRCREPDERLFYRGRWYPGLFLHAGASADDVAQLARFEQALKMWARFRDGRGRRAFAVPSTRLSDDAEVIALDDLSFAQWLDAQGIASSRVRWLCDYACRDDYGMLPEHTSAWAGLYYFASRFDAAVNDARPVVTWPGGNGALVSHLAMAAGEALRPNSAVLSVTRVGAGFELLAMQGEALRGFRAGAVISAVPSFVASRIIAPSSVLPPPPAAPTSPTSRSVGPWVVANLHLRSRPPERRGNFPPSWDNVLYDSKSLGYVVATHQAGADSGETVWTWYYPITDVDVATARASLLAATHEAWSHVILADLQRAHPDIATRVQRLDVAFWGHAMARPVVGSRRAQLAGWGAAAQPGVFHAHVDRSVVPVFEEAFAQGVAAARAAAHEVGG